MPPMFTFFCKPVSYFTGFHVFCSCFPYLSLTLYLLIIFFLLIVFTSFFPHIFILSRFAANIDTKEWKEGKDIEKPMPRPVSVMSSLSYRKHANVDSKGDALFSSRKENEDHALSLKSKSKSLDFDDGCYSISSRRRSQVTDDTQSVISLSYSEANSRTRKGMDSRIGDFNNESNVLYNAPSWASTRRDFSPDDDSKSTISLGLSSPLAHIKSGSRLDEGKGSPCYSRRSILHSPGSVSRADSVARSCRLSEFDIDFDDHKSVAVTERTSFSPLSPIGRSISMPPPEARSSMLDNETVDIKPVSHRNYLDPDLEKAINEVLSFKPIKFKRQSLEDSEEAQKAKDDDAWSVNGEFRPKSSLRRSASAVDCLRSSRSMSSASSHRQNKSKNKGKKKKRSNSSDSEKSVDGRKNSFKRRSKKSKKKSKKRDHTSSSSSSSSDSESGSDTSSSASTISYRSSSSIKKTSNRKSSNPEEGEGEVDKDTLLPLNKKDEKKRKNRVDSLMMKYLYRPDSN